MVDGYITGLSFLLGNIGEAGIVSEILFPELESYPNFEQF